MKNFAIVVSLFVLTLCFSETNFAQKKSRAKKKPVRITKPAHNDAPLVMKTVTPPCKETEVTYPYALGTDEESNPPVIKTICPPNTETAAKTDEEFNEPVKILSKPMPAYTDRARDNHVTGTVSLRVAFLESGAIGSISTIKSLGHGLTEAAAKAAQQIKFEPAKTNGKPVNSFMTVDYKFTIY